jgi:hypothetical protein
MPAKLAVKRLTGSDLTLFAHQFHTTPRGKQKAINLNADVFVSEFYPAIGQSPIDVPQRFPIDLYIYGPGLLGEYNRHYQASCALSAAICWRNRRLYNPQQIAIT